MAEKPATMGLKVVAGLQALGGVLALLAGVAMLAGGSMLAGAAGNAGGMMGGLFGIIGIVVLVLGVVGLALAYLLWKRNKIAYWLTLVFAALSVLSILGGNILNAIIGAVQIYFLWFEKDTKALFD